MLRALVAILCLVEMVAVSPGAIAADSGLKPTYHPGQPGWRRQRENYARRQRIAAAQERERRSADAADRAQDLEDWGNGLKVPRYTLDYAHPLDWHVTSLIETAKKQMAANPPKFQIEGPNYIGVAVNTSGGEDEFRYLLLMDKASGQIRVEAETLDAATLVKMPFIPDEEDFSVAQRHGVRVKRLSVDINRYKLSEEMVQTFLKTAKSVMDDKGLHSFVARLTWGEEATFSFFLRKKSDGTILTDVEKSAPWFTGKLPSGFAMSACDGRSLTRH